MTPRIRAVIIMLTALGGFVSGAHLAGQARDERSVRAAYVYHVSQFVTWPSDRPEIVIGYVGDTAPGQELRRMLNARSGDAKSLRVVLSPSDDDLGRCNIVYVAMPDLDRTRAVLRKLRGKTILTIGDSDQFAASGGMIGLVKVGDQIHLQVNLDATRQTGLQISSKLLAIAEIVRTREEANN